MKVRQERQDGIKVGFCKNEFIKKEKLSRQASVRGKKENFKKDKQNIKKLR